VTGEDVIHPKVFISYSHDSPEHAERVLELSDRLRNNGIDCILDQYEDSPAEGFPRWMDREIRNANFVLMVCTHTYYLRVMGEEEPGNGLGVQWESNAIYQYIYNEGMKNNRFIPVLLEGTTIDDIPIPWQGVKHYRLTTEDGYEDLYRRLTNQPSTPKGQIGKLRQMPPRKRKLDITEAMQGVQSPSIIETIQPERNSNFTEHRPIQDNSSKGLITTNMVDLAHGLLIGRQTELQLSEQQRVLYETLVDMDDQLANIYMGSLRVLADEQNPGRLALAAHGLRELVEKLLRDHITTVKDPASIKVTIQQVHEKWEKAVKYSNCYEGSTWSQEVNWSGTIDGPLRELLKQMGKFFQWLENKHPSRQQLIRIMLGSRGLPKPLLDPQVEQWEQCCSYFDSIAHGIASVDEFEQWVSAFERLLLDHLGRLQPRASKDEIKIRRALETQEQIKRIIVEGEANA